MIILDDQNVKKFQDEDPSTLSDFISVSIAEQIRIDFGIMEVGIFW